MKHKSHTATKNMHNDAPPMIVSYAQNREDVIIDGFFEGKSEGVYVDVGANHPVADSVTKLFYLKGWTGIHVEPNPEMARLLEIDRPKDVVIRKGVANKAEDRSFRIYKNSGLSTFSDEIKNETGNTYDFFKNDYHDETISVDTLENMLDEVPSLGAIDFMKIDVEGLEREAIESNNWKKYQPELICIEANHVTNDWHDLLKAAGYVSFFNDGLNEYFAHKSSERLKKFAYPESVLMRFPKVMPFIPHKDSYQVSDETFAGRPAPERTSLEKDLKGALSVLHGTLTSILVRRIVRQKRQRLEAKIRRNIQNGGDGRVSRVGYLTPKIVGLRVALVSFGIIMKIGFTLKAKLRRAAT